MPVSQTPRLSVEDYERLTQEYAATLTFEDYMESVPQATQRAIVVASMELLVDMGVNVTCFNELLVHYWHNNQRKTVVPDNMLVRNCDENPSRTSYAMEHESAAPFMMLEYVSESNKGKDYQDTYRKYEQELCTPYCLMFHPRNLALDAFRHDGSGYVRMEPNAKGRHEVPELNLEFATRDGWVRFWHKGKLLEVPKELNQRIKLQDEQINTQAAQINSQSAEIQNLKGEVESAAAILRDMVLPKAQQANRDDIIAKLPSASLAELRAFLSELDTHS